ncbi:YscO family type III secretion system apparatus protein [Marivita sp. GX14005]|uniref:type III secretion system stalk subunit SctO n=1 Tax=Marivita sp. GX14005 TaxID=2942276 RepID=UPI002018AAF5|nr:YscO family type III secretion system apparatus protein [Marivita sp. GX14005]MCL3883307.1 type III secretion protein [Marivita sp. GX14005]
MISQVATLGRVKRLREDKALRAVQATRREVARAGDRLEAARAAVAESATTLPAREAAIYAEIMRRVVGMGAIDDAKERVQALMEAHRRLEDRATRARDHLKRCEAALEVARADHAARRAETEKIDMVADDLAQARAAEVLHAEEAEIEESVSGRRAPPDAVRGMP